MMSAPRKPAAPTMTDTRTPASRKVAPPTHRAGLALDRLRQHAKVEEPVVHGGTVTYAFDTGGSVAVVGTVTLGAGTGRLLGAVFQTVAPGHTGRAEKSYGHQDTYRELSGFARRVERARQEWPLAAA